MMESGRRGSGKRLIIKWYYFDENGYCVTGWRKIDDNWYDFDEDGVLQTGRWIDEYYVGTDGRMLTDTWSADIG